MRQGRPSWTSKAPQSLLQAVHDAIDTGVAKTMEIYREFNLRRYVTSRTFVNYVSRRRRENKRRQPRSHAATEPRSEPEGPASAARTLTACVQALYDGLMRGEIPPYAIGRSIQALVQVGELDIKQEAEKRAAELHEVKMRDLRREVKRITTDEAGKERPVTRSEIFDLIDQVMRGKA